MSQTTKVSGDRERDRRGGAHAVVTVIAEGVETALQLALIDRLGCDRAQGSYFSEPVDAERFERLLRSTSSAGGWIAA